MIPLNKKYLVIEGNIGAGKTTLAQRIAHDYNARLVLETFADNPFLPKFYNNKERYAFPLELSFLAERYKQLKKDFDTADLFQQQTVADYHFFKSLIFSSRTLPGDEFKLYRQIFDIIYGMTPSPDLFVYLHRPVERLLHNIRKRGREYEQTINAEYLLDIQDGYFRFFREHPELPVLVVYLDNIDFVSESHYYDAIIEHIKKQHTAGIKSINLKSIKG